jgi:hypothetical protein
MYAIYPDQLAQHWYSLHQMTIENYSKDYSYDDLVVYAMFYKVLNNNSNIEELRKISAASGKCIAYQTEPLSNTHIWNLDLIEKSLLQNGIDEIWEMDIDNVNYWKSKDISVKYRPILYTNSWKRVPKTECDIDVLFYGTYHNDIRSKKMHLIADNIMGNGLNFVYLSNMVDDKLDHFIARSKVILDISHIENINERMQRQPRIAYALNNDKCVVSERSRTNIYQDMIIEFDMNNVIETITHTIKSGRWKEFDNISEEFKKLYR